MPRRASYFRRLPEILLAFLFVLIACAMLPHAGIEGDEAFFSWPIFGPVFNPTYAITIFGKPLFLMVFPYAGALKTLLYWPILKLFGPNVWAVRLPVVLIGALTIVLFMRFAERIAGRSAALVAGLLLATDPSFILTNTFDWGPVAIEHLLLVTGCLLFASRRSAAGFFCFGLAFWNKSVFVWAFAGLVIAALVVYWPEVRRAFADRRRVARCLLVFALGALPLIVFHLHTPGAAAATNFHPSFEGFQAKTASLRNTLDGSDLFGILTAADSEGSPKSPPSLLARLLGRHEHDLFLYGILFALLSAPAWWRSPARRAALFAIVFCVVFFGAMASVRYTGAAHHIVLLYPMPHLLVGIAVATLRPPRMTALLAIALAAANLLVVNQYIVQFERFGAHGLFTDALFPLSDALSEPAASGKTIYSLDLLVGDSLNLLDEGRLNMKREWIIPALPASEIQSMLANPNGLFVNRTAELEYYKGTTERLDSIARGAGFERQLLRSIRDSNGRIQFELFRFEKPT